MSEESERWKEKYLKSLERQETLERRWEARLDLLRRGLVRSTLAAEGSDRAVDQCMKEMREVVRTDDMDAALAGLLPRLEKAVLDSEQRREVRVEQIGNALSALVTQLQALPLSRDVSRPLKKFAKQLDERAGQAREMPLLLGELSKLQGDALAQLDVPEQASRPGLLRRLFGSKEPGAAGTASTEANPHNQRQHGHDADQPGLAPTGDLVGASPEEGQPAAPAPLQASAKVLDIPPVLSQPEAEAEAEAEAGVQTDIPARADDAFTAEVDPQPGLQPESSVHAEAEPLSTAPIHDESMSIAGGGALPSPDAPATSVPSPAVAPHLYLDSLPLPPVMAEAFAAIDFQAPAQDILYALPDAPEPSYSSVATHIEGTLCGLLKDLSLPERHQPLAQSLKSRLEHGLNWYELLPMLDDLAVLMLAVNDSGQHEFETYLQALNQRLEGFQRQLREASDGQADNHHVAREMDDALREQVDGLQSSVAGATDIDSLKGILDSRLEGLLGTLDSHRQQRDMHEQEVAGRLHALAERVSSMETEALGYRERLEEQRQRALVDPLTHLPNRAAWSERLDQAVQAWQHDKEPLWLAMIDLDHFKNINDSYGHLAGDKVLKIIANQLQRGLRADDFLARFGGEEFVLLMPGTRQAEAEALLESLRAAIEACPFHFKGQRVTITTSIGASGFQHDDRSDAVLKRADRALYKAKDAGRNRIMLG